MAHLVRLVGESENEDAGSLAGAVHLFTRTEDVWMETDKFYGDDTAFEDGFGFSIDWDGGLAALGSAETIYHFSLDDPNCPRAEFVATPESGLPPLAVAFTDQSTGNVTSWEWAFGDGASDLAQHPSHTYLESGLYNVSLVARSAYGVHREIEAFYVLTFASATVRNGSGVNDLCYASTSLPLLGDTWTAEVDASAHSGASLTFLLVYLDPRAPLPTPRGEILIDLASPRIVGVTAVPDPAGVARFSLPIPNDLALEGFALATQAGIFGSIELCNAVDLVLGF